MGNADDLQTGEWVDRVKKRTKQQVIMKVIPNLIINI